MISGTVLQATAGISEILKSKSFNSFSQFFSPNQQQAQAAPPN
jgi:hypothetical protein